MCPSRSYRILLCHNAYREAGGESAVFDTEVAGLGRAGHHVLTYLRSNAEVDAMTTVEKMAVVANAFGARRTETDIAAIVAEHRPDVAIVQNVFPLLSPSIYRVLRSHHVPVIQAVYNYRLICPDAHLYTQGAICERCVGGNEIHAVARRCIRSSVLLSAWYAAIIGLHRRRGTFTENIDRFMVPDRFLGDKLVQGGLPAAKMRINHNPIFLDSYQPKFSHDGYVLFIGRLVEQKGILSLIEAMRMTRSGFKLRIVGQGPLEARVRALCGSEDLQAKVSFLGPLWGDEACQQIASAAALVVPSQWYDNLPHILCQANAMGKPVLASRINGIPEYVWDDVNGYLFTPGDRTQIAESIDRLAKLSTEAYAALGQRARAYAERELDYANHHRRLMEIIAELVPDRSLGAGAAAELRLPKIVA